MIEQTDTTKSPTDEEITESPEAPETDVARSVGSSTSSDEEPETFPREYVEKLRDESAKHRTRAQRADDLAARLHTALVAATGRLADASDLPYDAEHLDNDDALTAAIVELLERKPHLASRRPSGDVGQGASASADVVDLAELLRGRAK